MTLPERYYVIRDGASGHNHPTVVHSNYASAAMEAARLARSERGQAFVVVMAVRAFRAVDIEESDFTRNTDPDIPF